MWFTRFCWILAFALTAASADFDIKVFDARGKPQDIDSLIATISATVTVFIGEDHERYDQHLSELEIIRRLYEREPNRWAIGVEFIQRQFQPDLDAYIAGLISEREFLRRTEYFDRWGFDFRLYRPIFAFAREHRIPMVALNAERELTERVAKVGFEGLNAEERGRLPNPVDKSDQKYRKELQKIFKQHQSTGGNFEHFWEAQLVWDETMAQRAAEYLASHPENAIVVLAGSGHIESGAGIPNRVRRRIPEIKTSILITGDKPETKSRVADYFLISKKEVLSPAPQLGIVTETNDGVRVKEVTKGGSAAAVGIQPKDRIVAIGDENINSRGDVRLALLDKNIGDHLQIRIERNGAGGLENLTLDMPLRAETSHSGGVQGK